MKTLLIIPMLFLVIGCASTNSTGLLTKIYNIPEKEIFHSTQDVIKNVISKSIGGFISSEIDTSDSILSYGDSVKYRSNFELYHFNAKENQKYKIPVTSNFMNSGFGISKHAMIPLVYILDSEGNIIDRLPKNIELVKYAPGQIIFTFEGSFTKSNKYFILVGGDNRFSGIKYDDLHYSMSLYYAKVLSFLSFSSDLIGFPFGNYELKIFVE